MIRTKDKDGNRWLLWPIRLRVAEHRSKAWFKTHGWQIGFEPVPESQTAFGCMPGWRGLYGQTFHLGRLKVLFGPSTEIGQDTNRPPRVQT
jgi:hypothetical protein